MITQEERKVPPDGGWGWMVALAFALNGVSTIPIMQGSGLIFKDTFPRFGFNATDVTVIINTNFAFGMLLGLVNGPLLRKFGCRKVAIAGSLIYSIGIIITAFGKSFALILISYGILASLGMGITMSAFSYSLNSYFTKRRGRAMGFALAITGLGSIILPQVTSYLIPLYGFQGTMLLYGSFSLHSLVGSMLLHPLKWHLKKVVITKDVDDENEPTKTVQTKDEPTDNGEDETNTKHSILDLNRGQRIRRVTVSSIDHDVEVESIYGFETPLPRQLSETLRAKSVNTINLGSSMKIFEEQYSDPLGKYYSTNNIMQKSQDVQNKLETGALLQKQSESTNTNFDYDTKYKKRSAVMQILQRIWDFYDLRLLRDPIYVNIMLGMSIAIFAEANFSILTPFILADMDLSTERTATVMSIIASADLIFRTLAPFVGEWLRQPPRIMYLISLFLLIISRSSLLFANGLTSVMIVAVGLGVAKGIRSVYMALVVPSYVPIDRLPYASGIQMVTNGMILISVGPLLGVIRDAFGSYVPCIIMINCVTALTVAMWIIEMYICRRRTRQKEIHS